MLTRYFHLGTYYANLVNFYANQGTNCACQGTNYAQNYLISLMKSIVNDSCGNLMKVHPGGNC